jgi:DMSO/TMAO reductase YedYZ molybdopterin-dependent catalytic subunit
MGVLTALSAGLKRRLDRILHQPMPVPPGALRRGPFRRRSFTSPARSPWLTTRLGLVLGVAFVVCFATGLLSHLIQHPPGWFAWPSRPVYLYRITQGLHVATGIAAIGLLPVKLWSVYPKLFAWPPARDVGHALERLSAFVLIAAGLFQLTTGVLNIAGWYSVMPFAFLASHYWVAWVAIGALLLHVAVKLPIIRGALVRRPTATAGRTAAGISRRGVLVAAGAATATLTLATLGQTVSPLSRLSVLAPRRPEFGPQGLPVNTSAVAAGVLDAIHHADYRMVLSGPSGQRVFTLADLIALPQTTVDLPITCVEGWSATGRWTGVRLTDLTTLVGGAVPGAQVIVKSLQHGAYSASIVDADHTADPLTLIALSLNGEPLHPDHGYPARLIAPNRPGALQTKWLTEVRVITP